MARYVVSVSCDLVKHSEAWKRIPRDPMAALLGEYKHLAEQLASQYGSLHVNFTGDGHFLLFEDADAAVRFALTLIVRWREAFDGSPALKGRDPIPLRVGIHFGDETQLDNGQAWVGRCGNMAKRIESEAEPGTAYVSEGLLDLIDLPLYSVSPIGSRSLQGDHLDNRVLYRVDQFDEAASSAKPGPQLSASDWFLRGVAMIGTPQEGTDAEAECYQEALRLRPDYPEAHYNYAILLRERGDLEGAEGHYQQALRLRPDNAEAHNNYAVLLKERGDLEGAEGHYQEALRLRPDYPQPHYNYGNLLKQRGDLEGAEGHYQEALRLRPDYPDAHNNYANLLRERGDLEGAEGHYQEALRLRPDHAEAHNNYAVLLKERGDLEGAEGHYQEALRLRPDYPKAHYHYAILLKQRGHPTKAKHHFEEASRLAPDDPEIRSACERRAWRA